MSPHSECRCNVRTYREARAWSQRQLARVIGVSQACVQQWETGVCYPELDTAAVLMAVLGVDQIKDLWPDLDREVIRLRLRMRALGKGGADVAG